MGYIGLIFEALGCMGVFTTLWQLTDLGSDIAFLEADIYSPEFRDHPSFAMTATFAITFDVLSSIVLLHAIRRKLIVGLRIQKALKQGKIKNDDQMARFKMFYLGGQVMTKFAIVLLLFEDIPEGIITGHVIANTYCERGDQVDHRRLGTVCSGVSGTAYFAIIMSCTTFLVSSCTLCSRYESGLGDFGSAVSLCLGDVCDNYYKEEEDEELGKEIFAADCCGGGPGLFELLRELEFGDVSGTKDKVTELADHGRCLCVNSILPR